jgi:hypothetical protein
MRIDEAQRAGAYEAAVLVRGTGVCSGRPHTVVRGRGVAGVPVGVIRHAGSRPAQEAHDADSEYVVEFGQAKAAQRLVTLLAACGLHATADAYTAGTRHRYRIHRVVAPAAAAHLLAAAWRDGYGELLAHPDRHRTPRQRQHLMRLAEATWRAAVLVNGPARTTSPGLRVPDLELATALVRAGRYLDIRVQITTRPNKQLVVVFPPAKAATAVA